MFSSFFHYATFTFFVVKFHSTIRNCKPLLSVLYNVYSEYQLLSSVYIFVYSFFVSGLTGLLNIKGTGRGTV